MECNTMARKEDVFPSRFLKAADLGNKPITLTIASAELETLKSFDGKEQTKTVLAFKGAKKVLPLNVTNWDSVASVTGEEDSDQWSGHTVELYPDTTTMSGKSMACIRIRAPSQRELAAPQPKPTPKRPPNDMDDSIPF
jgi:hypothetical protein